MNKKILLVFPGIQIKNDEGSKHRLFSHILEYNKQGYDVTVLAFCKDALFRVDKRFLSDNTRWIIRPCFLPLSKNKILRVVIDLYMKAVVAVHSWIGNYGIIQFEMWGLRSAICRNNGVYYITDVHGDIAHEFKEGRKRNDWFFPYSIKQQKKFVSNSDCCIVVSDKLKEQLEVNTGVSVKKHSIISCGVDLNRFYDASRKPIEGINLDDRIVLGYCGGFQNWQNFGEIIDVAIRLHKLDDRIFLLAFSNSDITPYLNKLLQLGDDNYYIVGLPSEEVPSHLKLMDAGFLLRSDWVLNRVSSPTKICEYLAAGVPLICTRYSGDYERSVIHLDNGFVANEPHLSEEEINELYKWLLEVKENRSAFAVRCVESVRNRTFEAEFKVFYDSLNL